MPRRTTLFRLLMLAFLLASISLFFLSPLTRLYAFQSWNTGDAAYRVYDDFPGTSKQSTELLIFRLISSLVILCLLFFSILRKTHSKQIFFILVHLLAIGCLFISWSTAIPVFLVLFLLDYKWKAGQDDTSANRWLVGLLVLIALILRLEKISNVEVQPLQPDSEKFLTLSQEQTWMYDTQHREPLWVWVNVMLTHIVPYPETLSQKGYFPVRLLTVLLSSLCVYAVYAFGRKWFSHGVGFAAALLMAMNKAMIYRSLQGLRLEMLILLTLFFLWVAWLETRSQRFVLHATALGLLGAMLLLLRTSCLPIVLVTLLWVGWTKKHSWLHVGFTLFFCFLPVIPYYIYCWTTFGDPLYSGNIHIHFYYRMLFGESPPVGERITPFRFMFHIFPWYQSVGYTILGTLDTFLGRYALKLFYLPLSPFLVGCSLVGYGCWIGDRKKWIVVASTLLLLGPMAFFMGILTGSKGTFDWRLIAHLFPFMAYAAADGFHYLLRESEVLKWMFRGNPFQDEPS